MNDVTLAWNANAAVNDVLIKHLTPEMLEAVTPGNGSTVGQHLTHMVECLKYWASELDANSVKDLPNLLDTTGELAAGTDLERIQAVIKETYEAVLLPALNAKDKGNLPHATVGKFLMYTVAHDAHHRGQILLALKTNGHALPDEAAMWQPWNS